LARIKTDDMSLKPERLVELTDEIGKVILGKDDVIKLALTSLLARGNLLIEDIPGVGKTTLAQSMARSIQCSFQRIQFTSDLLPSDVLGVKVYDPKTSDFKFLPGPIFNSIVLADEINRATPRSQSALLEAMSESQVTIEGETHPLPEPFMVIATENPIEHHGAYPLPDSQLDRFLMSISVGYPEREDELRMLRRESALQSVDNVSPVMDGGEVMGWQSRADGVSVEESVVDYMLVLVERTRQDPRVKVGVSPRGALALRQAAKSHALLSGRDYALPDDVKAVAGPALSHRLILSGAMAAERGRRLGRDVIAEILDTVPVPV